MHTYRDRSGNKSPTVLQAASRGGRAGGSFGEAARENEGASSPGRPFSPSQMMQFQRTMGNRAVAQMMSAAVGQRQSTRPSGATKPIQRAANKTGMPDSLKTGMESMSGFDLSDVRVHYNSEQPALVEAAAFAQGEHIHLGPGQEKHLPHEAWHVVQQKQGRVQPTAQAGGVSINDDAGLEKEADQMGERSLSAPVQRKAQSASDSADSRKFAQPVLQAVWMKHNTSSLLRWDEPLDGLRWYLNAATGVMFFQIEKIAGIDEEDMAELERLEGRMNARTLEEWCRHDWFQKSESEPLPAQISDLDLGPTTELGVPIPRIGFGTDGINGLTEQQNREVSDHSERELLKKENAGKVIGEAIATGYRLFDTAESYGTLGVLGDELYSAMRKGALAPEDTFVIYKIRPQEVISKYGGELKKAVLQALSELKVKRSIDVLMLHSFPEDSSFLNELIIQMKDLVKEGIVRYLGLSNVSVGKLQDVAKIGDSEVGISFVQNKFHPMLQDEDVLKHSQEQGITYMGYNILGSGSEAGTCRTAQIAQQLQEQAYDVREDDRMKGLSSEEDFASSPQLALSWAMQKGTVQIPGSRNKGRMLENFRARYKPVSEKAMNEIDGFVAGISGSEAAAWMDEEGFGMLKARLFMECNQTTRSFYARLDKLKDIPATNKALIAMANMEDGEKLGDIVSALTDYMANIDAGLYKDLDEFTRRLPGDYTTIKELAEKQGSEGLITWYHHQNNDVLDTHGCKDAKHEAMMRGVEVENYREWLASEEERHKPATEIVLEPKEYSKIELTGDSLILAWDWDDDPIVPGEEQQMGYYLGKEICFYFDEDKGDTIVIREIRKTGT